MEERERKEESTRGKRTIQKDRDGKKINAGGKIRKEESTGADWETNQ
jgi:hypothetical protein